MHENCLVAGQDLCVYCRKRPIDPAWRPFCSQRCKLLDLRRWIDGEYRVPGEPVSPEAEPPDEEHEDE